MLVYKDTNASALAIAESRNQIIRKGRQFDLERRKNMFTTLEETSDKIEKTVVDTIKHVVDNGTEFVQT